MAITRTTLTFGPYADASGSVAYAGLRGWVQPSDRVVDLVTGAVVADSPLLITIAGDGTASVSLAFTDQDGISPRNFTYAVTWNVALGESSPGNKSFHLPEAVGASQDFDQVGLAVDGPAVYVPVISDPTVDPRLDDLEQADVALGQLVSATQDRLTPLEARHQLVVSSTNPHLSSPGVWVQTGLGSAGTGMTFWIEDGK